MYKFTFFASLLALLLFACKNDPKPADGQNPPPANHQVSDPANPMVLAGNWIAIDFCAYASQYGSVLAAMNNSHLPYAYALSFNPARPDSVRCYNAFESWSLPVQIKADTIELKNAAPNGKSVFLIYHSTTNQEMTMIDPTNQKTNITRMIKSKATVKDGYAAFATALNHNVLNGVFTPIGKGATEKVMFSPTGSLQGLKGYDRYELCTGGDCFVAGQDIDVITFSNAKDPDNSAKMFGYRYNGQNDTLTIFNLINAKPEIKGGYKTGAPAYKFARQEAQ